MQSRSTQKLAQALINAQQKNQKNQYNARVSTIVFWSVTVILTIIASRDIQSFFTSTWGVRCLTAWTLPVAWYIMSSRWAEKAAAEFAKLKRTAAERAYPGFCSHETGCTCREDFLKDMETQGIDLYL